MKKTCTQCGALIEKVISAGTVRPFCNSTCYGHWQKGKKFEDQGKPTRLALSCAVPSCTNPHFGKGYCRKHYLQIAYTPPKRPTDYTTSIPHKCNHCGTLFIAHHKAPKYCSQKCCAEAKKKPFIIKKGYRKILIPTHPRADSKGYVFEHIVVIESVVGRLINQGEEVHHKDRDKQNNAPSNLVLCANHAEHMSIHHDLPSCENEK